MFRTTPWLHLFLSTDVLGSNNSNLEMSQCGEQSLEQDLLDFWDLPRIRGWLCQAEEAATDGNANASLLNWLIACVASLALQLGWHHRKPGCLRQLLLWCLEVS